ncbi:F0F1 ATP synthase subunit gamma [Streptoalloteichus hindustanus]|uniref:ATP synthase gamma chain n=1 Tax=Streptoalloteichus hindustanus TaxID=2017 RepID=A0A1M5GB56_STRHI|nr:F0F1 ATP synthase subunit gamma [Streptoalloteichus hindustanus]SHG00929.1 ATP synthase F1 subcomplex gamma subunit [Streptoalloteichus hindustanus]
MAAELRALRGRIRSVQSTKKITRAYELIATSRMAKAQARTAASKPYADEIVRVLSALAGSARLDHPFLVERERPKRAGVLVITSDKGMCGGYNANVIRAAEELQALLREQGKEPVLYVVGRKGVAYYGFRQRRIAASWTGFSEIPHYTDASVVGDALVEAFLAGADDEGAGPGADGVFGVDELHVVYTEFRSMLTQTPVVKRVAPLEVEYSEEKPATPPPGYEFEPDPDTLLGALLPKYVKTRLFAALLESAASELANRQRAMKAATDNANELIRTLTREANQARQAQITQEISEIVGGADALAAAGSDE